MKAPASADDGATPSISMLARFHLSEGVLRSLVLGVLVSLLLAGRMSGHGGYHERMAYLTEEAKKNPTDPLLQFQLADLHGQHGDLSLALLNLDRVDELAPGKYLTDLLRGEAWLIAGEFAKAKAALDRQLGSHPECARAWLIRARAEQQLGEEKASLADYRQALNRTPSPDPDLVQEVSIALATHACQQEAAQVLATAIERLGAIPSLNLRALDLELEMKEFDAALHRIDAGRQAAPRPEPWMARRAAVLAQAGRVAESRAAWEGLAKHLDGLPEQERHSYAMKKLNEEAREALYSLDSRSATQPPSAPSPTSVGK